MAKSAAIWLAALIALAAAGCSSTAKPKPGPLSPTQSPTLSSASVSPSSSPSPTPSSSAPPLSPFESDPAVRVLRAWARQAALALNAGGKFTTPALTALETPSFVPLIRENFADDSGLHYPGPVPFTPVGIAVKSSVERRINSCFIGSGFAIDPKTGKPRGPVKLTALTAQMFFVSGSWRVNRLYDSTGVSCSAVKVVASRW